MLMLLLIYVYAHRYTHVATACSHNHCCLLSVGLACPVHLLIESLVAFMFSRRLRQVEDSSSQSREFRQGLLQAQSGDAKGLENNKRGEEANGHPCGCRS